MKLLVVDHNALDPVHRVLYGTIVALGGIQLRLIVPTKWFNNFTMLQFTQPSEEAPYELFSSNVLFPGRTHRLIYHSLSKHLREFKPDVLFMNSEPENFQTFQAALKLSASINLVFSSWRNIDHATIGYPYRLSFLHKRLEQFVLSRASHGILFNNAAKDIFGKSGFESTTVIPPLVDLSLFRERRIVQNGDTFFIGYVGRLTAGKGVDILLHALASLAENYKGIIVGDGEEKYALIELARDLGISNRVQFQAPVRPDELPNLLATMDVVTLPSRSTKQWREQFGRILVEAMACGVPVIGSSSGEIPAVVADAGIIFKEGSIEALSVGIQRLCSDKALRINMVARGLRRVRQRFSLEVVAAQYHRLFLTFV